MTLFDNYECEGQLSIFDIVPPEPKYPVRTPCDRQCKYEWCSKECFLMRGYIWNHESGGWLRDKEGKARLRDKKECDWEPQNDLNQPQKCCGVTPWLHTTKCCHWDASKPQNYMMYYICPMCGKTVIDEIGWVKYRHGTYDKASKQALEDWNNPKSRFEIKEFNDPKNGNYPNISLDEREEWEKLYGISWEEFKKPLVEISNRLFREKQLAKQRLGAE